MEGRINSIHMSRNFQFKTMIVSIVAFTIMIQAVKAQVKYTPVLLTEFMRHGARTTWKSILNLSLTSEIGVGNITANGMRMHFLLGSQIRQNYPSIFNSPFTNFDVDLFSSSSIRTIMSLQSHLLGLFPLGTGEQLSLDTNSKYALPPFANPQSSFSNTSALPRALRVLPYQVNSVDLDYLFMPSMYSSCGKVSKVVEEQKNDLYTKYSSLFNDLSDQVNAAGFDSKKYANSNKWSLNDLSQLYDEMRSYENYYGKLYSGLPQDLYNKLYLAANINFPILFPTETATRLMADGAARQIIKGMENYISGSNTKTKLRIFSGHDTGIYSHMLLYNLTDLQCNLDIFTKGSASRKCENIPEFASSFLYELNKDPSGQFYVKVLLNGTPLIICDENSDVYYCKYDKFKETFQKKLFFNQGSFEDYCGNPLTDLYNKNSRSLKGIIILLVVFAVLLIVNLIAIWILNLKRRQYETKADKGYSRV